MRRACWVCRLDTPVMARRQSPPLNRKDGGPMRSRSLMLVTALVTLSAGLAAQQPAPPAGNAGASAGGVRQGGRGGPQGPAVVSPEVHADRTVTVRLLAPKATEVTVTGEIL